MFFALFRFCLSVLSNLLSLLQFVSSDEEKFTVLKLKSLKAKKVLGGVGHSFGTIGTTWIDGM